ncbi:PKD2-like protein, partial [Mya arenaria]
MTACVVFLASIQFLKLLQFNKKMNMLGETVKLATKDLKVFSIAFLLYFLAFVLTAYLLFGKHMAGYNGFVQSAESTFAFTLGAFDFDAMSGSHKFLGPIFFFAFIMVIYIGLMSIFLTIIADAFTTVKEQTANAENEYEMVDFIWKKFKGIIGSRIKRDRTRVLDGSVQHGVGEDEWLVTFVLSFFQSVIIVQPIKVRITIHTTISFNLFILQRVQHTTSCKGDLAEAGTTCFDGNEKCTIVNDQSLHRCERRSIRQSSPSLSVQFDSDEDLFSSPRTRRLTRKSSTSLSFQPVVIDQQSPSSSQRSTQPPSPEVVCISSDSELEFYELTQLQAVPSPVLPSKKIILSSGP